MQVIHPACPALPIPNQPILPLHRASLDLTNSRNHRPRLVLLLLFLRLHFDIPVGIGVRPSRLVWQQRLGDRKREKHLISGRRVGRGSQGRDPTVARWDDFDCLSRGSCCCHSRRCRHRCCCGFAVLVFVDFALRWGAVARVGCGRAVFRTCKRVAPIPCAGLLLK